MSHMTFQHILYLDILLPTIYLVLNTILAIHLIYSKEDGIWYGILMMLIPWIPALFLIPNEIYYNTATFGEQFSSAKLMKITLNSVFFPAWPIYNYMTSFRSLTISDYLSRLDKINSIKQIMHSSLHMVLTIFLIMRGRLLQEDETSCVKDNLGRSVCFKYIVILSLILSTILIIGKVIKEENYSFIKLPVISCTLVFRTVSFAFILTYIDWWSIFALLIIILEVVFLMQLHKNENGATDENRRCLKNETNLLQLKKETDSENISSCVNAFLHIQMPLNVEKDLLVLIVTNTSILINVFVVFFLVKFLNQFDYENNVINENLFIVLILVILCYGVSCSLFGIYTVKMRPLSGKYGSIFNFSISPLILISFPLVVILTNFVFPNNEIYLFTIESDGNLTEIEAFPFQISSLPEDDLSKFEINYNDISWNIDDENNSHAKKLCFEIDHSGQCNRKDFPLTISVSMKSLDKLEKLRLLVRSTDKVFISNARPTLSDVAKQLNCSSATTIYVNSIKKNLDDYPCRQSKFLDFDNQIVERKCIAFGNSKIKKLDVKCNKIQNLNDISFNNGSSILKINYLTFTSIGHQHDFCCNNKTHFSEYLGECSVFKNAYFSQIKAFTTKYRTPDCSFFESRIKYSMFLKLSKRCIIIVSYYAKCKQEFELFQCDIDKYSCHLVKSFK